VTVYFVDTSALSKRYIAETGSLWVQSVLKPATGAIVYIVRITAVELISAITRRERSGTLTSPGATSARAEIRTDLAGEFQIVEVTGTLVAQAMMLAEAHGLRGYDAVQLAAALEVNDGRLALGLPSITLLSADTELNAAARAEGLVVEDPNQHP
jgi:predicted nucleic acid-binding protein